LYRGNALLEKGALRTRERNGKRADRPWKKGPAGHRVQDAPVALSFLSYYGPHYITFHEHRKWDAEKGA